MITAARGLAAAMWRAEFKVYRKGTRIILFLEGTLFVPALAFDWEKLVIVITIDFFIVGISLLAGKVKLQMHK